MKHTVRVQQDDIIKWPVDVSYLWSPDK